MNNLLDNQKDRSVSVIRLIAFGFIITCHIQQYLNISLAWWFNVGVQIFLCISGYLYGGKDIPNEIEFYRKQLIKILTPYYITVIIVMAIQFGLFPEQIGFETVVKTLLCYGTLKGGEHLWYIPSILMCYVMTPFLLKWIKQDEKVISHTVIMLAIYAVVFTLFYKYFNPAIMSCYFIGLVLGYTNNKFCQKAKKIKGIVILLSLMNIVQIILDYVVKLRFEGTIETVYNLWCNYNHVWLGITIFVVLKSILDNIHIPAWLIKITNFSDHYSYEGYLVHQFFIIGPMSLMSLTKSLTLNIIIILFLILVFSYLLNVMKQSVIVHIGQGIKNGQK